MTETLTWSDGRYKLKSGVIDITAAGSVIELELALPPEQDGIVDNPFRFKVPESGLSLIVQKVGNSEFPVFKQPRCTFCPGPNFVQAARMGKPQGTITLLVTVTDLGVIQDVRVAKSVEPTLDAVAVEAVRMWKITPEVGYDGKPFTARVPIRITF